MAAMAASSWPETPENLHSQSTTAPRQHSESSGRGAESREDAGEIEGGQATNSQKTHKKKNNKKKNRAKKKEGALDVKGGGGTVGGSTKATTPVGATLALAVLAAAKDHARNVARAAGVDWGGEEPSARMCELQTRHDAIVDVAEAGSLTLLHIKEHNEFLAVLTRQIADEGEQMKRKFRLANAKQILMFNSDAKRAAQHQAQASSIQRKQKRYNNEVAMAQCEVDWLRNSPAYAQAMAFLDEHWVKTAKGDYVSKKDLSDDADTSFEDLLSSMKLEEV